MAEKPFRVLPKLTAGNAHFWQGGAEGELRFLRCDACKTHENNGTFFIHESLIGRKAAHCWTAR